jgi:hypothetical protein
MSDIDRHRIRYLMNGWPLFDSEDEDTPYGFIDEPLWAWADLTPEQQDELKAHARHEGFGDRPYDETFPFVLDDYGIACPHKWKNRPAEPVAMWRECVWCRVSEPLGGRVVTLMGKPIRVPDPPPPVWRVPIHEAATLATYDAGPTTAPAPLLYDEYHWDGHAYV